MKFSEIPYVRPNVEAYKAYYLAKVEEFKNAKSAEEQLEIRRILQEEELKFGVNPQLAYIRNSINTADPIYEEEQAYRDEISPTLEVLAQAFRKAALMSSFRSELIEVLGDNVFNGYEVAEKTFSPEVVSDLQEENALVTQYNKLVGGAKIFFNGEEYDLSTINKFNSEADRELRYGGAQAKSARYETNDAEHNKIYDDMVEIRQKQAKKLGYKNYIAFRYDELERLDYTAKDVAAFREHIRAHVVPVCAEIYKKQAEYIGVDELYYHDEYLDFPEGNPKPIGTPQEILEKARNMYHELSPDTGKFIDEMMEREMFNVLPKPGKAPGGYCSSLDYYKIPFIFANFDGTDGDTNVLTHEVGHAYQVWKAFSQPISEYYWPTSESAEIHSMSMEFLTMPWMKDFYGDKAIKYQYMHMTHVIKILPFICALDEFQHEVFEQAEQPIKRTYEEIYLKIEQTYLPHRKYLNNPYLQQGNNRKTKHHLFDVPFYMIDYALAQICAIQFWIKAEESFEQAWADYVHLCSLGGSKPFLQLLKEAGLESPFEPATIEKCIHYVQEWLAKNPLEKI